MTDLNKPVRRKTRGALDGNYGCDRGRRLITTLLVGDIISIRPEGTRREETISLMDVYQFAIRCRVNRFNLEKARARKQTLQIKREAAELKRRFR